MKKIYILLMHTNTVPSRVVKFFTRYEYSHVAISLDKSCSKLYSFGRKNLHSVLDGGFSIENKDGEFFKVFSKTICRIYEIKVTDKQYKSAQKLIHKMEKNKEEYKYDFFGVVIRYFKIPVTFKNKFVCSYFVAFVLQKAKIYNFNKDICLIKPKDFTKIEGMHQIYSGSYLAYV